ncbi:MAG: hypothetical protein HY513_02765 [Candidatus Aenigmarchaeota archaeon]|nr:hypothetical protein [Candidatus Aenigmarchaeota archaeon]
MEKTITISKEAFDDLVRLRNELDTVVESLELMKDKEFMDSYRKAKEQVKKREFVDWNGL